MTLRVSARDESPRPLRVSSSPGSGSQRSDFTLGSVLASRCRLSVWRVAEPAVPRVGGHPLLKLPGADGQRATQGAPAVAASPVGAQGPGSCRCRCRYWLVISLKTKIESVTRCL